MNFRGFGPNVCKNNKVLKTIEPTMIIFYNFTMYFEIKLPSKGLKTNNKTVQISYYIP